LYMAAAQAGVVFPAAETEQGWAWAGVGGTMEAHALSEFVRGGLESFVAQQQAAGAGAAGAAGAAADSADLDRVEVYDPLAERVRGNPEAAAELERLRLELQQELQQQGTLGGKEVGAGALRAAQGRAGRVQAVSHAVACLD
jgi:hypothetical protein